MGVAENQAVTGLYPKTISSRLSELTKSAQVERVDSQGGAKYRVSTLGISRLGEQLSKKMKPSQGP